MAQYSDAFGELVRNSLNEERLSDREVARRSRGEISHYTVGQMRAGVVPYAELIVAFARVLKRDPNVFLEAAGKGFLRYHPGDSARVRQRVAVDVRSRAVALG